MKALVLAAALVSLSVPAVAAEIGEDGLHKADWMRETFKDLREDLEEANAEGKRLAVIFEQRGCIYCEKMHEEVFPRPEIDSYIRENFFVVQMNLFGDLEVVDFDGEALPEKQMAKKWDVLFTPTVMFLPEDVPQDASADQVAVASMPGAFGPEMTLSMLRWVNEKAYDSEDSFQAFHARRMAEEPPVQ